MFKGTDWKKLNFDGWIYIRYVCRISTYEGIRQWPVTDIGCWPLVNESSRHKKNRIACKIFFNERDCGSDFKGYPLLFCFFYFATIHLREVSNQYLWLVTGVFFHLLLRMCLPRSLFLSFSIQFYANISPLIHFKRLYNCARMSIHQKQLKSCKCTVYTTWPCKIKIYSLLWKSLSYFLPIKHDFYRKSCVSSNAAVCN